VILGSVGDNFGAGMTGGMAFIYDRKNTFESSVNPESVVYQRLQSSYWEDVLKNQVREHERQTQSTFATNMLAEWDTVIGRFWQVCPKEMISRLESPLSDQDEAAQTA